MLPFTRESLVSDKYQLAVDRSLIDYRLGLARSQGVEFTWANDDTRVFLATSNGAYTLNGIFAAGSNPTPPWGTLSQDAEWATASWYLSETKDSLVNGNMNTPSFTDHCSLSLNFTHVSQRRAPIRNSGEFEIAFGSK